MSLWTLYWITILPSVVECLAALVAVGIVFAGIGWIGLILYRLSEKEDNLIFLEKIMKRMVFGCLTIGLLSAFIPSERQMYTILGGYAATNVEGINKLPANLVGAANAYLEKMAKEAEPEKEKK